MADRNQVSRGLSRPYGLMEPFGNFQRELERFFEGSPRWMTGFGEDGFLSPKVDVAETEVGLEIKADLPGLDPKDIQVDITDGVLTLRAERKSEREEKDDKTRYHLVERTSGTFLRRFSLPFDVQIDKVEASFDKGVLKILAPRSREAAKRQNKIEIKSA